MYEYLEYTQLFLFFGLYMWVHYHLFRRGHLVDRFVPLKSSEYRIIRWFGLSILWIFKTQSKVRFIIAASLALAIHTTVVFVADQVYFIVTML